MILGDLVYVLIHGETRAAEEARLRAEQFDREGDELHTRIVRVRSGRNHTREQAEAARYIERGLSELRDPRQLNDA